MAEISGAQTDKKQLRNATLAKRDAMSEQDREFAATAIADRAFPIEVKGKVVSGYSPMRSEINPIPLMHKLVASGARLALPVIAGRGHPLTMHEWMMGDELGTGVWGIREPKQGAAAVDPDVLLVPLACFDRAGHRIGYGAGFYDMTIARLRGIKPIVTVGIAFALQEIEHVPTDAHDERLDLVITERDVIDLRGRA